MAGWWIARGTMNACSGRSRSCCVRMFQEVAMSTLEQLAISPQCGFSSTVDGNQLSVDDELAKLRLVVDTAREIWPDA